jgi:hypothetical protein
MSSNGAISVKVSGWRKARTLLDTASRRSGIVDAEQKKRDGEILNEAIR